MMHHLPTFCSASLHRVLDTLSYRFLPVFDTVDTRKGWNSQVCPRAIGGINMGHSLSLPTVTYICMGELPHCASEMFTVNRVPNCAAVIRNLTYRFVSRLSLSSNVLVCSIIDSDLNFVS